MIISIFASIWSQNLWDELILKNEIEILKLKYSKLKNISENEIFFKVFTYDLKDNFYKEKNVEYLEYFPIWIKQIKNIFKNIFNFYLFIKIVIKSDLIVIWWGWIIYDNEIQSVWNPLKQLLFRSKIFKFFNKKVEFFRVWINIKNKDNLKLIKKIFSVSDEISVRDEYSYDLLKKLNFNNIKLLDDPVFYDNKTNLTNYNSIFNSFYLQEKEIQNNLKWYLKVDNLNVQNIKNIIEKNNIALSWKKIWLSLRNQNRENYTKNIIEIINYFLKNNCEIILIPHSFHKTDKKANDYIFLNKIKNNINSNKIKICNNLDESYKIYTNKIIDLNLASRLHSIILSQVYNIGFIAISYSTKTDEVIKKLK